MNLNDNEFHIITAKIMFKTDWKGALEWLKSKGMEISQATYFRTLANLDEHAQSRINEVARKFPIIVADEIDKFRGLEKMMYEEYRAEENHMNRVRILKMIAELQPLITSLYDETRHLLEGGIIEHNKKTDVLSKFTDFTNQ